MTVGGPLIGAPGGIWLIGGCAVRDQPPCVIAPVSGPACGWPTAGASESGPAPGTLPACGPSAPRSSARIGPAAPRLAGDRGTAGARPGGGAVQLDGTGGGALVRGRAGSNGPRMASSASGASTAGDDSSASGNAPAAGTRPQLDGPRAGVPGSVAAGCPGSGWPARGGTGGDGSAGGGAGQAEGLRTGCSAGGVVPCGAWLAGGWAGPDGPGNHGVGCGGSQARGAVVPVLPKAAGGPSR